MINEEQHFTMVVSVRTIWFKGNAGVILKNVATLCFIVIRCKQNIGKILVFDDMGWQYLKWNVEYC